MNHFENHHIQNVVCAENESDNFLGESKPTKSQVQMETNLPMNLNPKKIKKK